MRGIYLWITDDMSSAPYRKHLDQDFFGETSGPHDSIISSKGHGNAPIPHSEENGTEKWKPEGSHANKPVFWPGFKSPFVGLWRDLKVILELRARITEV